VAGRETQVVTTPAVLLVGAGSIGRRHLGNLRALGIERVGIVEPDPARRAAAGGETETYAGLTEAIQRFHPDAALVCTPPVFHVPAALELVRAGADVFVEKPVAATLDGVDQLIKESEERKRIVQVGYNLRFHPIVAAAAAQLATGAIGRILYAHATVAQYLPDWRPQVDYRQSYTARADLGGGILLDASHELDYLTWMMGAPATVSCEAGHASSLEVDVEDSATLLLGYPGGSHAVVHMDFVRRGYHRTFDFVGETGNLTGDIGKKTLRLDRGAGKEEGLALKEVDMYRAEMEHFLECVRSRKAPLCDLRQGKRTLEITLLAKAAAADGRRRSLA
jgi:predicted dehydrogenase